MVRRAASRDITGVIGATGKGIDDFLTGYGKATAKRMPSVAITRRRRAAATAAARRTPRRR